MTPDSTDDTASPKRGDAHPDAPPPRRDRWFSRPRWWWNVVAFVCLVAATISLLNSYMDAAFVMAALGVVAWFLALRDKYKVANVESRDTENDMESEFEEDRDDH